MLSTYVWLNDKLRCELSSDEHFSKYLNMHLTKATLSRARPY